MEYSYNYEYVGAEQSPFMSFLNLVLTVLLLVSYWKVFVKAGWQGWEAIVPLYNLYVMFKIAGLRGIQMLWLLVPLVNIYFIIKVYNNIAKSFGKNGWYTVGMIFLPYIFWPILGFGKDEYTAPKAE